MKQLLYPLHRKQVVERKFSDTVRKQTTVFKLVAVSATWSYSTADVIQQ
jgi:hypothetical protein